MKKHKTQHDTHGGNLTKEQTLLIGEDEDAVYEQDECKKCRRYKGRHALRPCGHGLFCYTCVNKLIKRGLKMKYFGPMCLHDDCTVAIRECITLINVNTTK